MGKKLKTILILIMLLWVGVMPTASFGVSAIELNDEKYDINFILYEADDIYTSMEVDGYSTTFTTNFPAIVQSLSRVGYRFLGWSLSRDGSVVSSVAVANADINVYAKWQLLEYKITYELNRSNVINDDNITKYTVEDEHISLSPARCTGYDFLGWYVTPSCSEGSKVNVIDTSVATDITLYAKWEMATYSISYELNGGENNILNPASYNINTKVILDKPIKVGHIFDGWYLSNTYETKVTEISKGNAGDVTLYAKWTPREYTILFKLPDGTTRIEQGVEYGTGANTPKLNNAFFEVPMYSEKFDCITGDTIITVSYLNLILVYVAGVLLLIVVVALLGLNHLKKKNSIKATRKKYREKVEKIKDKYRWY